MREAAISLNILRTQHVIDGVPDGVIMRHFEVPGAGGFLLSTRSGGATRLFPEGGRAEYFADLFECVEKCQRYLDDPSLRVAIAKRASDDVHCHHSYFHRAAELVELLRALS